MSMQTLYLIFLFFLVIFANFGNGYGHHLFHRKRNKIFQLYSSIRKDIDFCKKAIFITEINPEEKILQLLVSKKLNKSASPQKIKIRCSYFHLNGISFPFQYVKFSNDRIDTLRFRFCI